MSDAPETSNIEDKEVHAVFCGPIDQGAVQRIFNGATGAITQGTNRIHLLFQSAGGTVGDAICVYNFFRSLPIDLVIYNAGSVCSAAVLAYLGARERKTSAYATFMIHKTYVNPQAATSSRLESLAHSLLIDDERTEAIIRQAASLSEEKWAIHNYGDLWFSSQEAVESGLANGIGEFAPPKGQPVFIV